MKNGLQINPMLFKMAVLFTCFMLVMFYNKTRGAEHIAVKEQLQHAVAVR